MAFGARMHFAVRLVPKLLALLLASSSGPDAALWPPFVPKVVVERSVLRLGDRAFVLTTTMRTFPVMFNREVESLGNLQMPTSETVTLAQILNASTESDRRLNAMARKRVEAAIREAYAGVTGTGTVDPMRQTSVEVAIRPTAVAPGVVAAELRSSVFTAHLIKGWESTRGLIWSVGEGRLLTAEDLFDPATSWWRTLVPRMLEAAYGEPFTQVDGRYRSIERSQTPLLGRNGLCLKFREGEEGALVLAQPICLPWRALRPYLRDDLPFDPSRLEEALPDSSFHE